MLNARLCLGQNQKVILEDLAKAAIQADKRGTALVIQTKALNAEELDSLADDVQGACITQLKRYDSVKIPLEPATDGSSRIAVFSNQNNPIVKAVRGLFNLIKNDEEAYNLGNKIATAALKDAPTIELIA